MRKIDEYISEAFKYAFSDIKKGLVGGFLYAISGTLGVLISVVFARLINPMSMSYHNFGGKLTMFFGITLIIFLIGLIVGFLVDGYYVRVMRTTVEGSNELPEWSNITDLLIRGFLYAVGVFILLVIFLLPLIILLIIGAYYIITQHNIGNGLILLFASLVISIPFFIVYVFYTPLAEVNYSVKGFLGFFEFKRIFRLMSIKYIILVILIMVITFIINAVIYSFFAFVKYMFLFSSIKYSPYNLTSTLSMPMLIVDLISYAVTGFVGFFMSLFSKRAYSLYYKDKVEENIS
ncbi:conserved membrane protein of unknown function [Methanocaldococcus lauensis]|uniref:Uncharacterized protein n=1 Tax=Methanocaldococcus lauensis TaxID=2546128 RepID=A0A8D6SUZ5_9EURY|nr:DUF4013 domain-containing protein [Methanocaldococcus lauensis]CAB3289102.1 conserved membrane protein of unknown function [Methanocaldococcus lauensis]